MLTFKLVDSRRGGTGFTRENLNAALARAKHVNIVDPDFGSHLLESVVAGGNEIGSDDHAAQSRREK